MYTINRLNIVSDIELLIREKLDKRSAEYFCVELYFGMVDIIISSLNNELEDRLIDRLDLEFRERDIPIEYRNILFDYTFNLLEKIRSHFIMLGAGRSVKYKKQIARTTSIYSKDHIVIDFESTAFAIAGRKEKETLEISDVVEDNPSLDILNAFYDNEDRSSAKNKS